MPEPQKEYKHFTEVEEDCWVLNEKVHPYITIEEFFLEEKLSKMPLCVNCTEALKKDLQWDFSGA